MTNLLATILSLFASLSYSMPASATDYNYGELQGNVFYTITQGGHTDLTIRVKYSGYDQFLTTRCPDDGTALANLCKSQSLFDGYCQFYGVSGTNTSGYRCFDEQVGKCVSARGIVFAESGTGKQFLLLDALYTKQQSYCTTK
jgi:hypothetical protein